jgi:DNA (cytosine-5)-methyltransferase 1
LVALPINVFDFFSGCGGTSAGLRASGMDIVMGLDFDQDSSTTFQKNFPEAKFIHDDIRQVETERIRSEIENCGDNPILFSGCAPCQPFSVQNQTRNKKPDARIDLLAQFGRFVEHYLPDYVLVENVPGIE